MTGEDSGGEGTSSGDEGSDGANSAGEETSSEDEASDEASSDNEQNERDGVPQKRPRMMEGLASLARPSDYLRSRCPLCFGGKACLAEG